MSGIKVQGGGKHSGGKAQQKTSYKHSDKYRKLKRKEAEKSRKINTRGKRSVK